MKKYIGLIIFTALVALVCYFAVTAFAKKEEHKTTICHNGETLTLDNHALEAHFKDDKWKRGHEDDYFGKCEVEPSVTPTVTPTPIEECNDCVEPTPEPEVTPEVTPAPKQEPQLGGAPVCNDEKPKYAPTITYFMRNGTDALIKWTTTDTQEFVIYYGPTKKDLVWNTGRVKGQEYLIHQVNQMLDGKVCSVSGCGQETCGAVFVDP